MTTRSPPLFKRLFARMTTSCQRKLQLIQNKLNGVWTSPHHPKEGTHPACLMSSLEEELVMEQKTLTVTQWRLDDNLNNENNEKHKKITVVVMEFPSTDPYQAQAMNYTIEGEDPNLRITHYPSSNRLH